MQQSGAETSTRSSTGSPMTSTGPPRPPRPPGPLHRGTGRGPARPESPASAELVARVDAALRRIDTSPAREAPIELPGLTIDPSARRVLVDGEEASLTGPGGDERSHRQGRQRCSSVAELLYGFAREDPLVWPRAGRRGPYECALVTATQGVDERGVPRFSVHRHVPEPKSISSSRCRNA
jgi:hypothetical protein